MNDFRFEYEIDEMSAACFCSWIRGIPSRSGASVYISTPGGNIFAGGEMVIAVEQALERGCTLSFEMGAIVASMGASLVAAARARGCRVVAHESTQMMFHGCHGVTVGGADEHRDAAKCMADFNQVVINNLKKCGVDDCEEWFAADREKWLNAREAVALGLADEIVGDGESAGAEMVTVAHRFAAKWNGGRMADEIKPEVAKPEEAAAPVDTVDDQKPAEVEDETHAEPVDMIPRAEADARVSGMQAAMQKQINDLKFQLDAKEKELAAAKAETTSLTDALNAAKLKAQELADEVTSLAHERDEAKNALATLNGKVNHVNVAQKPTWTDARKHLASLPMAERAAFYSAHKADIDNIKE